MKGLKESGQAVGAETLTQLADFAPPTIMSQAARLQSRQRFFNLVVTNVPGPQFPLYLLGRRLRGLYPRRAAGAQPGARHRDHVLQRRASGFGLLADFDALPDLDEIAGDLEGAIDDLAPRRPACHGRPGAARRAAGRGTTPRGPRRPRRDADPPPAHRRAASVGAAPSPARSAAAACSSPRATTRPPTRRATRRARAAPPPAATPVRRRPAPGQRRPRGARAAARRRRTRWPGDVAGPPDPALRGRRPGRARARAAADAAGRRLARGRMLRVATADDPRLRQFVEYWLGPRGWVALEGHAPGPAPAQRRPSATSPATSAGSASGIARGQGGGRRSSSRSPSWRSPATRPRTCCSRSTSCATRARRVDRLAEEAQGIVALVGFPERAEDVFNAIGGAGRRRGPGHLPQDAPAQLRRLRRGALLPAPAASRAVIEVDGVTVGLTICEDDWVPDGADRRRGARRRRDHRQRVRLALPGGQAGRARDDAQAARARQPRAPSRSARRSAARTSWSSTAHARSYDHDGRGHRPRAAVRRAPADRRGRRPRRARRAACATPGRGCTAAPIRRPVRHLGRFTTGAQEAATAAPQGDVTPLLDPDDLCRCQ